MKVEADPGDQLPPDPACCSFGAGGSDEVVVVPWPVLLRQRVAHRAGRSRRYRWWVLVSVLAGLLSINVTFTILAVALPRFVRYDGRHGLVSQEFQHL